MYMFIQGYIIYTIIIYLKSKESFFEYYGNFMIDLITLRPKLSPHNIQRMIPY